jgi:RNA polymerase sigma factor (sigma-70 family)
VQTENGVAGSQTTSLPIIGKDEPVARPPTGVPEWFEPYFRQNHESLVRAALSFGGARNRQDAEDAVAQVMFKQLKQGHWDIEKPHSYFTTAVIRAVFELHRKRNCHPEIDLPPVDPRDIRADDDLNVWEDEQWVTHALDSLPAAQREIMQLIIDDFDAKEIAELLGKKESTVRSNLRHAQERLRSQVPPQSRPPQDPQVPREEEEAT